MRLGRGLANTEVDAHSQLMDGSQGPQMEELEKVSKELKRSATLSEEQHYELTSTPELLTLLHMYQKMAD